MFNKEQYVVQYVSPLIVAFPLGFFGQYFHVLSEVSEGNTIFGWGGTLNLSNTIKNEAGNPHRCRTKNRSLSHRCRGYIMTRASILELEFSYTQVSANQDKAFSFSRRT